MNSTKDFQRNLAWGLFLGVLIIDGRNGNRLWSIFGIAALYAVGTTVLGIILHAANKRWPKPLHWPWQRRRDAP